MEILMKTFSSNLWKAVEAKNLMQHWSRIGYEEMLILATDNI